MKKNFPQINVEHQITDTESLENIKQGKYQKTKRKNPP